MPCTTVLAGKLATNDRSTMIARTDDGHFDEKKLIVVEPDQQPKIYKSVESHLEITLPENPMRYTSCPSVDPKHGIWAATGINAANVGMTATETTTSNPRVLAADPMVELREAKDGEEERCGGIGEEDIVVLVLPYIRSAREGVLRLGALLEQYGTYESNGIAFNDENEVWWLETIGGHHWIAKKIPEDRVIINPNQFGMDSFDLEDAFGARESHLCSADLREFISENHLDLNQDGKFNPRDIFGSHRDMDHIYNTPRAWFMGRCLAPHTYRWDGENADFTPESDDIPWSYVPERKVAAEDIQYLLSSHYQGTPYDPYAGHAEKGGIYRPIGINRTGVTTICQIRSDVPDAIKGIEWVCFGSTTFSAWLPVYTNVPQMPDYLSNVTLDAETDNLYWVSRFVGALADKCYGSCIQNVWGYQDTVNIRGRQIVLKYDRLMLLVGVACMGVAQGLGVPLPAAAGAVCTGAFFGDKVSPLSDSPVITATVCEVPLMDGIRHALISTGPAYLISLVFYFVYGLRYSGGSVGGEVYEDILSTVSAEFWLSPVLLLPVLVVVVLILMKKPTIPTFIAGIAAGAVMAMLCQGVSLHDILTVMYSGFSADTGSAVVNSMLNRGGFTSMLSTIGLLIAAGIFGAPLRTAGVVDVLLAFVERIAKTSRSMSLGVLILHAVFFTITGAYYVSYPVVGGMVKDLYPEYHLDRKNLMRTMLDTGTGLAPMVSWSTTGSYTATTLGVSNLAFAPFAPMLWLSIVFSVIYAVTGIGTAKAKED